MFRPEKSEKVGVGSIIQVNMDERYLLVSTAPNRVERVSMSNMSVDFRAIEVKDVHWLSSVECRSLFDDKCASFPNDFQFDANGIKE